MPLNCVFICYNRGMKPVTIKDIAKAANVNQSTVSKALRGLEGLVSPDTAKRITDIAAQMGYRPNAVAASLRTNRSNLIGMRTLRRPEIGATTNEISVMGRKRSPACSGS